MKWNDNNVDSVRKNKTILISLIFFFVSFRLLSANMRFLSIVRIRSLLIGSIVLHFQNGVNQVIHLMLNLQRNMNEREKRKQNKNWVSNDVYNICIKSDLHKTNQRNQQSIHWFGSNKKKKCKLNQKREDDWTLFEMIRTKVLTALWNIQYLRSSSSPYGQSSWPSQIERSLMHR